jgi:apolipoprotein N-acyltransferase
LPGVSTFDARPEAVFVASAGGAATSGGAGIALGTAAAATADGAATTLDGGDAPDLSPPDPFAPEAAAELGAPSWLHEATAKPTRRENVDIREERVRIVGRHAARERARAPPPRASGRLDFLKASRAVPHYCWAVSNRALSLLLAAAGGLLLALSGPPTDVVLGPWLGPALFYAALGVAPAPSPRRRVVFGRLRWFFPLGTLGFVFGFACNAFTFRFVVPVILRFTTLSWVVALIALVLLAAAHALRFFVAELLFRALVRAGVHRVAAFAAAMYLGTFVPMMFPWTTGGAGMAWPITVQLADLVGERGLVAIFSVISALAGESIVSAISRGAKRSARSIGVPLAGSAALMAAVLVYGAVRMRHIDEERDAAPHMKIALVQPSIEARERWERGRAEAILAKLTALTRRAEAAGASLVIWPEAAYPYSMRAENRRAPLGTYAPLQPGVHGPILTGTIMHSGDDAMNSAVVVRAGGMMGEPYHKMHLLWFGETVPLADQWPWLKKTFARGTGLTRGDRQVLLQAGPAKIAVLNCFEDTLESAGREAASVDPNLLVNITNDSWFAGSQESALHLRVASMRTIEERRDLVRAVNFGPTTWVDANGRLRARLDPPEPSFVIVEPALLDRPPTIYARFGDVPWLFLGTAGIALATVWRRRKAEGRERAIA